LAAALNIGVATGMLPTKGLPLPLVSYGGSSLVANLFAVGILFNISRQRGIKG
jgi:cell division protein FtsW